MKRVLLAGLMAMTMSPAWAVLSNDGWFVDEASVKRSGTKLSYEAVMMAGVSDYVVRVKDGQPKLYITNKSTGQPEPVDDPDTLEMFKQARAGLEKQMK